ncbi:hypothetical protein N7457_000259 [Penicillium paradoxum]|uniref:uncharacterized protein n=1 Tax=Penicillium paradoxum TaxID=176176 RepID=UPI002546E6AC|nr:uncharacterized protein N7457_000259 [Penicillium paradoxum]KAJ5793660.1 hypothetical protein N7457_000259 [Penicillium paradoxum]
MARRSSHGTYTEERTYFLTTLHAQIDILKDNYKGNREQVIKSLGLLLRRIDSLRMAAQAHFVSENPSWTDKCNHLHQKVGGFRDTLVKDPKSTRRIATDIESMMIFLEFCIPWDLQYHIGCEDRRGDRSGAPSPEPR